MTDWAYSLKLIVVKVAEEQRNYGSVARQRSRYENRLLLNLILCISALNFRYCRVNMCFGLV
jgi:hypothetical protein